MADPKNIIKGTPDSETLEGTPDNDRIISYGGEDTLYGLEGDDQLNGYPSSKGYIIGTLRNLSKFLVARVMILSLGVVIETNSSAEMETM